jgi:hypothetical protein
MVNIIAQPFWISLHNYTVDLVWLHSMNNDIYCKKYTICSQMYWSSSHPW